jgi:ubiquinone/menaquinone biosynthesis C-methylase UbiE
MVADLDKRLILSDYSADYIILANTLFMLENKSNLIKECSRILTPDGYLLFVEWKEKDSLLGPKIDMKIKKEDAIKMFYENGFEVKKELEAGDYHYAYIFSR